MVNAYKILVGKPKRRDHSQNLAVDGKILVLLEWVKVRWDRNLWSRFIWLRAVHS
jgi:hypothetical protein